VLWTAGPAVAEVLSLLLAHLMNTATIIVNPKLARGGRRWATIALVVVAVVLAYGMSIGPAFLLLQKHSTPQGAFNAIYAPIEFLADESAPLNSLLNRYLQLWRVSPGPGPHEL
jgi:hypothetical protein